MKNLLLLSIFIAVHCTLYSQNVGIGTASPAAKLMVASTSTTTEPTLALFDSSSNGGPRLDFGNAGGSINWKIFTVIDNAVSFISTFKIGYGGENAPILTLRGDGNLGVNNPSPAYRLDVAGDANFTGPVRMNSNPGTAGQALISNGLSAPSWQTLPQNPTTGFFAYLSANVPLTTGVTTNLVSYFESFEGFDDGNNFNISTGQFVAPSAGMYHFDIKVSIVLPVSGSSQFAVRLLKNGITFPGCQSDHTTTATTNAISVSLSSNLKLAANDIISIQVLQSSGGAATVVGSNSNLSSTFSGHKVY